MCSNEPIFHWCIASDRIDRNGIRLLAHVWPRTLGRPNIPRFHLQSNSCLSPFSFFVLFTLIKSITIEFTLIGFSIQVSCFTFNNENDPSMSIENILHLSSGPAAKYYTCFHLCPLSIFHLPSSIIIIVFFSSFIRFILDVFLFVFLFIFLFLCFPSN